MIADIYIIAVFFIITWVFTLIIGISIVNKSSDDLKTLDSKLATVIQELVQGVMSNAGDFEPPNPVQMVVAQFLASKMQQNPDLSGKTEDMIQLARNESGKFK